MMKLMVALDRTEKDDTTLARSADIARKANAELVLVNVFSPYVDMEHAPPGPREEQERLVEAERLAYLQDKARSIAGVPVRPLVGKQRWSEEVYECIARLAREQGADVLVVSSKRITSLVGLILGSTAQMLLRVSPCPVMVVRPD